MPYHTGMKKKDGNPKKKKLLTESQKKKLKEMKKSHTTKHINAMKKFLLEGKSFKQAHDLAVKEVGK